MHVSTCKLLLCICKAHWSISYALRTKQTVMQLAMLLFVVPKAVLHICTVPVHAIEVGDVSAFAA